MASVINASSSGAGGLVSSGDASGVLQLQNNGSASVTLDTSGNVGIGTSSPSAKLQIDAGSAPEVQRYNTTSTAPYVGWFVSGTRKAYQQWDASYGWILDSEAASTGIVFRTQNAERMRIDSSGNLLVGTTTSGLYNQNTVNGISVVPGTSSAIQVANDPAGSSGNACLLLNFRNSPASGSKYLRTFYNGTTETGSISLNGTTGVLYNITSDYRLKNNPISITGAKEFVMALQPKSWDWHDGSGKGVGFIAHEFMEVAKYSGHGEKDAVDADGNPVYQTIQPSSSEVMANIVALLQEQQALITAQAETINALTARVVALESKA